MGADAAEDAEMPCSSEEGAGDDRNTYKPPQAPFYAKIISSATGPDPGSTSVFDHILSTVMDALHNLLSARKLTRPSKWGDLSAEHLKVVENFMDDVHKGKEAATLKARPPEDLELTGCSVDGFRGGHMLGNYSLDLMLASLVRALGPQVSMAGVKADSQALSPWLLPDSTILAKTPYVFGAIQQIHADLLRRLAKRKHLQPRRLAKGKDLRASSQEALT